MKCSVCGEKIKLSKHMYCEVCSKVICKKCVCWGEIICICIDCKKKRKQTVKDR